MNPYSNLLSTALQEVSDYRARKPELLTSPYLDNLISLITQMISMQSGPLLEQQISALGRLMIDEFPLTDNFSPAISEVLDAHQRMERQQRRKIQ